ncbi:ZIP family metal transporter [Hippea jasoniae]|uniref:ZIP family metal transporter n=1 Tax=Hippea jasoniae TaxID=944479 RepID=UPI000557B18C|nr:ZIP family metal transporter [Hippea jasoniae]
MIQQLINNSTPMQIVLYGAVFVMAATSFGSVLALIFKKLPEGALDLSMAFSGGIMLVASFTSLILPSIKEGGILITSVGIIAGFFMIFLIESNVPHEHFISGYDGPEDKKEKFKRIWLIAIALIIHNFPEGFAVGVSIINDPKTGIATAIAIGIQDIPEGLAVSLPLMMINKKIGMPLFVGILSGVSEFITAIIGGFTFSVLGFLLPFGLSLAGGAMIYVTVKEVFPEIYSTGKDRLITFGFLIGFLTMLILDSAF